MRNHGTDLESVERALTRLEDTLVDRQAGIRADGRQAAIAPSDAPARAGRSATFLLGVTGPASTIDPTSFQLHWPLHVAALLPPLGGMQPGPVDGGSTLQSESLSGPAPCLSIFQKVNISQCLNGGSRNCRPPAPEPRTLMPTAIIGRPARMNASGVSERLNLESENLSGSAPCLSIFQKVNLTQCLKAPTHHRPPTPDHRPLPPDPRTLMPIAIFDRPAGMDVSRMDERLNLESKNLSGPAPCLSIFQKVNLSQCLNGRAPNHRPLPSDP
jgi:hypothetical protein